MLPTIWRNRRGFIVPTVDDFFEKFFYGWPNVEKDSISLWTPRVDVHETDRESIVDIELPGIDKKDVKVELKDNLLTVSGERKHERKREDSEYSRVERHYGRFERTFGLPETVNAEKVSAEYKNGILVLTLPKTEKAIPKEISIDVK